MPRQRRCSAGSDTQLKEVILASHHILPLNRLRRRSPKRSVLLDILSGSHLSNWLRWAGNTPRVKPYGISSRDEVWFHHTSAPVICAMPVYLKTRCPHCGNKLKLAGKVKAGPRGGLRNVYLCTTCWYRTLNIDD